MAGRAKNILWIGVDQMRQDTAGCYGNSICRTPHLDQLASDGVRFGRAYTPSSLCTPSRASMFTGQFAFRHGLLTNCDMYHSPMAELPRPENLLHHRLAEKGYQCGFVGKSHFGTELGPQDYGFSGFSPPGYGDVPAEAAFVDYLEREGLEYSLEKPIFANPNRTTCIAATWDGPMESTPDHFVTYQALDLLEDYAASGSRFFLTCQYWGPHQPYFPSREYAGMHNRDAIEPWNNFHDALSEKPRMVQRIREDFYRSLPENWEGWRELVGLYYDFTAMIDAQVGRLIEQLDRLNLREDTLIVFTSDHGDMTGSQGGLCDKGLIYEEAHRVPLIVAGAGVANPGRSSDAMLYNMDIFPTLLDCVGVPLPEEEEETSGKSFRELLENPNATGRREAIYLEFHGIRFLYSQRAMVTADGWKYVFTPGDRDEVYDLNKDPGELQNLKDDPACSERSVKLQNQLLALAEAAGDPLAPCIAKYFGQWKRSNNQPDPTADIGG